VECLDLSWNHIKCFEMESVTESLQNVRMLKLMNCNLRADAVEILAKALQLLPSPVKTVLIFL